MTAIDRTAYPRFKSQPTAKELADLYTPTPDEIEFVRSHSSNHSGRLNLLMLLKAFQRLGYFPYPEQVPVVVVNHLRSCLKFSPSVSATPALRSRRRYEKLIRTYLQVKAYDRVARQVATNAIAAAAQVKDHPSDLINVAIEELIKERYELPAFSTLDRLVRIRTLVNERLFEQVAGGLSMSAQMYLESLLLIGASEAQLTFTLLKAPPKSAKLSHIEALQAKFDSLMSFGDAKQVLVGIATTKVESFAAQAKTLELADLRDLKCAKRLTLLVCLLYQAQIRTRDHIVEMFLKRMQNMHNRAKERLVELRDQHLKQTETLLEVLAQILEVSTENIDDRLLGAQVQSVFQIHGGPATLLQQCQEIAAYNSDNYLPLLWRFYSRYRKLLFRLVRSLDIRSTSQDQSLIDALKFVLSYEHRRSKWLPFEIDVSFVSARWQRLVVERHGNRDMLVRPHLEVCIFTYLATELKTGDACVVGSEIYADFREQLLSWKECELQVEAHCQELGIPAARDSLIEHLQSWLTQVAQEVDQICKDGTQVTISKEGQPILKRLPAQLKSVAAASVETAILQRLTERSVLDILCNVEHWLHWTRHFGPASGSEPKIDNPAERYILTVFGYGCNLGPNQTARHTRGQLTSRMLSHVNRLHIQTKQLEAAMRDMINAYNCLPLPKYWGSGKKALYCGSKHGSSTTGRSDRFASRNF